MLRKFIFSLASGLALAATAQTIPTDTLYETKASDPYPYRIPALIQARNGNLIAISDYRICGNDIGYGQVDIHARISKDNGRTWGEERTVVEGTGVSGAWDCGFGDAALVADAESDTVLLMCVCGNVVYSNATRKNPGRIARLISTDGGETWGQPVDQTEDIFSLFDNNTLGALQGAFIGSGKLCQSKLIKVGKHRRIYAPLTGKPNGNRVVYSDDLGETWKVLGEASDAPAPAGDEPKCMELPDGSVLLSSRTAQGRFYNIFTYTDIAEAKGQWGNTAVSSAAVGGIKTNGSSGNCNGSNLLLPAIRKADGAMVYVLLQTLPFGPNRANVGIFYKEIADYTDFASPDAIARDWDGELPVSTLSSAYSETFLQQDGTIGLIYEENNTGSTFRYDIIYKRYTLEDITDGAYSLAEDFDVSAWFATNYVPQRTASFTEIEAPANAVGAYDASKAELIRTAGEALSTAVTTDNVLAFTRALYASLRPLRSGGWYRMQSVSAEGEVNAVPSGTVVVGQAAGESLNVDHLWRFDENEDGTWNIYSGNFRKSIGRTGNSSAAIAVPTQASQVGSYNVNVTPGGVCRLICSRPGNASYGAIGMTETNKVVSMSPTDDLTRWYLIEVTEVPVKLNAAGFATGNFPFAVQLKEDGDLISYLERPTNDYIVISMWGDRKGFDFPASTPFIIEGKTSEDVVYLTIGEETNVQTEEVPTSEYFLGKLVTSTARDGDKGRIYVLDSEKAEFVHTASAALHNQAYLQLPTSVTEEERLEIKYYKTGITSVDAADSDASPAYDLQGRRLRELPERGIVVRENKKLIVK